MNNVDIKSHPDNLFEDTIRENCFIANLCIASFPASVPRRIKMFYL